MNWTRFIYHLAVHCVIFGLFSAFVEPVFASVLIWFGLAVLLSLSSAQKEQ